MANTLIRPIFVVGTGRSGTTILARWLGYHPGIAHFPNETKFFPDYFKWLKTVVETDDMVIEIARNFLSTFLGDYLASQNKLRILEKTPNNVEIVGDLMRCFPDAQIIHIYRDPRDTVVSLRREIGYNLLDDTITRWISYISAVLEFGRNLPATTFYQIKYESLVHDPASELQKLFAFLKEDVSPIVPRVLQETRTKAIGQHKTVLSDEERIAIEQACKKYMEELGYV
ncbi:MAG: sulfotransferase [Anaerolineae bacterium]|nr:sulfotransferase [Anaerolineae bacterium]